MKDRLYQNKETSIGDFVFDSQVVDVFDDMINRSVPGYRSIITMTGVLAHQAVMPGTRVYDLGCSTGAGLLAISKSISHKDYDIYAVDSSQPMIETCRRNLSRQDIHNIQFICSDIRDVSIENASLVVLNFTLQFISQDKRAEVLKALYEGMNKDGVLVISEKIKFENELDNEFQTELHHEFKKMNGYSDLEIARKRTALENVLVPDTLNEHRERLSAIGFNSVHVWFQCFNFMSLVAIK